MSGYKSITIPEGKAYRITAGGDCIIDRTAKLKLRFVSNDTETKYVVDGMTTDSTGDVVAPPDEYNGYPVAELNSKAFQNDARIRILLVPATITTIEDNICNGCTNLEMVTFKGIARYVPTTMFANCPNLHTINVPWAEGYRAGAPWGATNAKINYNYKL